MNILATLLGISHSMTLVILIVAAALAAIFCIWTEMIFRFLWHFIKLMAIFVIILGLGWLIFVATHHH